MKKIWLIGLIILIIGLWRNLSFAESSKFKPGSEPDGFRDIKWETDLSTLEDMEYFWTDPSYGGIKFYIREKDDLHIGETELTSIQYGFWKQKFSDVKVYTKGYVNWSGLKDAVFEKFGKGYQSNEFIERYFWFGDITDIILEYNEVSEIGSLWMSSRKIAEQQKAYDKQKAKEGAETGF